VVRADAAAGGAVFVLHDLAFDGDHAVAARSDVAGGGLSVGGFEEGRGVKRRSGLLAQIAECLNQGVDVRGVCVKVARGAGGGWDPEALQQRKSGEITGTEGDATLVEGANDLGRSAIFQCKGKNGDAIGRICGAEYAETRDAAETFESVSDQGLFAFPEFGSAQGFEILNGRGQSNGAGNIRSAGLEFVAALGER